MVDFTVNSVDYFSGWPSKLEGTIPAVPSDLVAYQVREPHGDQNSHATTQAACHAALRFGPRCHKSKCQPKR